MKLPRELSRYVNSGEVISRRKDWSKYNDRSGKADRKGGPRNGGRKLGKRGHAQGRYSQRLDVFYVMRNPEICTELLEVLLPGHKIARVEYIELASERTARPRQL